jgi:hypothetical protein
MDIMIWSSYGSTCPFWRLLIISAQNDSSCRNPHYPIIMSLSVLTKIHEQLVNTTLNWNVLLPFLVLASFPISNKKPSIFGIQSKEWYSIQRRRLS